MRVRTYLDERSLLKLINDLPNFMGDRSISFEVLSRMMIENEGLYVRIFRLLGVDSYSVEDVRIFLSMYMILLKNDEIFVSMGVLERRLIEMSGELEVLFMGLIDDYDNEVKLNDFVSKFREYKEVFNGWKSNDRRVLLLVLSNAYNELLDTERVVDEEWRENICKQKIEIEREVMKIGGVDALDKLVSGELMVDLLDDGGSIRRRVYDTLDRVYWDKIRDELSIGGRCVMVIRCLKDLRGWVKKLVPSRDDLHSKWERELKIELLDQDVFDLENRNKYIRGILMKLMDILSILESAERVESKDDIEGKSIEELIRSCYMHIGFVYDDLENLKKKIEDKL